MKEGTPVVWLFGIFILIAYIGSYIWSVEKENDRLYNIATEQKQTIEEQKEDIDQLKELTEAMIEYIYTLENYKTLNNIPRSNSPIHNKPL